MEIANTVSQSEPPRYESQLRRGKPLDQDDDNDDAAVDDMVDAMEKDLAAEAARDEEEAEEKAKKASQRKLKAKAKGKAAAAEPPCKKARSDPPKLLEENLDAPEDQGGDDTPTKGPKPCPAALDDDLIPEYPPDAYEPPPHISGNNVYSNAYKKVMYQGKSKAEAQSEARYQCLVFRTHGVVSKSKVGMFRAQKNKPSEKKKNQNLAKEAEA